MSENDAFEIGWALCGGCCFDDDDKEPYLMGFFPSPKHANRVLEKMQVRAIVGEYQVRACVWAPEGFYIGEQDETPDQVYARVRALEEDESDGDTLDPTEAIVANVLTEAFPEEFEVKGPHA